MSYINNLPKPFTALAPMEDVTDTVFRQIVMRCGRPDLFFTEFLSVEGLLSDGHDAVIHRLKYDMSEQPLIAQLWGVTPEKFYQATKIICEMGFAGVDINMGCPVPKVVKHGAGAALIEQPSLAKEIFCAVKEAAHDLPVSIKTRLGFKEKKTEEWGSFLLGLKPDLLTIHARTAKELYKYSADWDEIVKIVQLRDLMSSKTLVMGNGDVVDNLDIKRRVEQYKVDGVMVGRAILRNLYVFQPKILALPPLEKLDMLLSHVMLFEQTWGRTRNFQNLKKYFRTYVSNIPNALPLRVALMKTSSVVEVKQLISDAKMQL